MGRHTEPGRDPHRAHVCTPITTCLSVALLTPRAPTVVTIYCCQKMQGWGQTGLDPVAA